MTKACGSDRHFSGSGVMLRKGAYEPFPLVEASVGVSRGDPIEGQLLKNEPLRRERLFDQNRTHVGIGCK